MDTVGGANAPLSGTAAFTTSGYFNNGLNLPDDTTPKAVTVTTPADMLGQSKLTESMWFKLATPGSWVQAYQQPTVGDTIGIEANVTANKINLCLSSGEDRMHRATSQSRRIRTGTMW